MGTRAPAKGQELLKVLKVIRRAKTASPDQIERLAAEIEQSEKPSRPTASRGRAPRSRRR